MTNSQRKWQRKLDLLKSMRPSDRRAMALNHFNMSGNEWVRMQVDLGMMDEKALRSLSMTPRFNPPLW